MVSLPTHSHHQHYNQYYHSHHHHHCHCHRHCYSITVAVVVFPVIFVVVIYSCDIASDRVALVLRLQGRKHCMQTSRISVPVSTRAQYSKASLTCRCTDRPTTCRGMIAGVTGASAYHIVTTRRPTARKWRQARGGATGKSRSSRTNSRCTVFRWLVVAEACRR